MKSRLSSVARVLGVVLVSVMVLGSGSSIASPRAAAFQNWLSLRDASVVKQTLDYSCGLAALATLLSYHFEDPVSEAQLLQQLKGLPEFAPEVLNWEREGVSFAALQALAETRGYKAVGLRVSAVALATLQVPVIIALNVDGLAHFSVLRGLDSQGARYQLADPSWGNVSLTAWRFMAYWATVDEGRGKLLLLG